MPRLAYFISPHGFGHAARASAVMAALHTLEPALHFDIFTTVPRWFFVDSLSGPFTYHPCPTDIGLVQASSLVEDLPATVARLDEFLPFDPVEVERLVPLVERCRLVLCDIAPLGIAVAHQAGRPAVLVENFTWDWIYEGYLAEVPELGPHIAYLAEQFASADYHIQTEPVCRPRPVDLTSAPVSRPFRAEPAQVRQQLGLADGIDMVLLTMGGIPGDYRFLAGVEPEQPVQFVIAGHNGPLPAGPNVIGLPRDSGIFHPDLVRASQAVIGKLGYSTLAELYQAGVPFGYVARPQFRESAALARYVDSHMAGLPLTEAELVSGRWLARLPDLLALPRQADNRPNGAEEIARLVAD